MSQLSSYLADDHQQCDQFFADAEMQVSAGKWEAASAAFQAFFAAMEHHLTMEEELLFPAFEQASGMSGGPTQVMRMEHEQMRELFGCMAGAVAAHDSESYLGDAETLLILMQQHNAKEEQILYPMFDQLLGAQSSELIEQLEQRRVA